MSELDNMKIKICDIEIGDCIYVPELNNIMDVVTDLNMSINNTYYLTFACGKTFKYHFNKKFFIA